MHRRTGYIFKVNGNMVSVNTEGEVIQNEMAYILHGQEKLKSEVIRVRGSLAEMQVYESTTGIKVGDCVEFSDELLSVELGPGLLGQIFDGLQNPLPLLAKESGFFLKRGLYIKALSEEERWNFSPFVNVGDKVIVSPRQ